MTYHLDYYQVLQVHHEAETDVINAAYRKLAAKYHPDVNRAPGAAEKMKQINNAYEVLSDPNSRAEYDASLKFQNNPVSGKKVWGESKTLNSLVFVVILLLLVFVLPRFGPAILLTFARFTAPLLIFGVVVWLVYRFIKSR